MLQLRPYQNEVIKSILENKSQRQLVVLPTGTGKTIVFCELARQLGKRTLILAHRDELIQQAVEKMRFVWPDADIGIVKGKRHEPDHQITVASVQSLHQRRLDRMPDDYQLIITDEAHHATASTYKRIYAKYEMLGFLNPMSLWGNRLHVGVTATPNRTDKKLLGEVYDDVVFDADMLDFIPSYLSDLQIIRRDSGVVLDGIAASANDLNCHDLSDALNTLHGNKMVVDAWIDVASECQLTLAFCADIAHTRGLRDAFLETGILAASIDSTMHIDERRSTLKAFFDGDIKVLCNCGILVEGFDCPQIDCILLVRPTRSELLLRQMIGRGTRLYPGKEKCKIVDIACVSNEWDLVSPTQLFGLNEDSDETKTVMELKAMSEPRMRKQWGEVDFSKAVAGIYDTRSPGQLYWQKIRWKGWLLRCGKDGSLRILPIGDALSTVDKYVVQFKKEWKTEDGYTRNSTIKIQEDLSLDMAFSVAESYARENDLDVSLSLPDRRWHAHLATDAQKNYIRGLGGREHITEDLTKKAAGELITFFKDKKEFEKELKTT